MNKQEALKKLEEAKKMIEECEKVINKPEEKWRPTKYETYWYVNNIGRIENYGYYITEGDEWRFLTNNCFKTKEEAKEHKKKIEYQAKYRQLAEESKKYTNEDDFHWSLSFNTINKKMHKENININTFEQGAVYFKTEESLHNAVKKLGEENVKRYILGVE